MSYDFTGTLGCNHTLFLQCRGKFHYDVSPVKHTKMNRLQVDQLLCPRLCKGLCVHELCLKRFRLNPKTRQKVIHWKRKLRMFFLSTVVDTQAQTALRRKWDQWRSGCGKMSWGEPPNSHFNFQNSSITETSRPMIGVEQPAAAVPSTPEENSFSLSPEQTTDIK